MLRKSITEEQREQAKEFLSKCEEKGMSFLDTVRLLDVSGVSLEDAIDFIYEYRKERESSKQNQGG